MKTLLNLVFVFAATVSTALAQTRGNTPASRPVVNASYPRPAWHPEPYARSGGHHPTWPVFHNWFNYVGPDYCYAAAPQDGALGGQAALADFTGSYNFLASLALMNELEMQRLTIENQRQLAEDQLRLRKMQVEFREAENQKRMALIRQQNAAGPRAVPSVKVVSLPSGDIAWPTWLQDAKYSHYRNQVEELCQQKDRTGQVSAAGRHQVEQMTEEILEALKANIRNMRSQDYMAVKLSPAACWRNCKGSHRPMIRRVLASWWLRRSLPENNCAKPWVPRTGEGRYFGVLLSIGQIITLFV